MEIPLWLSVLFASAVGISTYAMYRHKSDQLDWRYIAMAIFLGAAMGLALTFGICQYLAMESAHYHHIVAFGVGLLGIPTAKLIINLVESHGMQWCLKRLGFNNGK
jgi:ethanolamine transporter EutH